MRDRWAFTIIGLVASAVVLVVAALLLGRPTAQISGGPASPLPALNATLNGACAVLLIVGYAFIRRRRVPAHRACMLGALAMSILFLVSYVAYHFWYGSRPFAGQGWIRWVYFPLLVSHITLAAAIVPLALTTVYRALSADIARHRRIARWTLPIWLYVSVTGVLVYLMLYHW